MRWGEKCQIVVSHVMHLFSFLFCIFFISLLLLFSSPLPLSVHCDTTIKGKRISCQNNQNTLSPLASILITQVYLLLRGRFNKFRRFQILNKRQCLQTLLIFFFLVNLFTLLLVFGKSKLLCF